MIVRLAGRLPIRRVVLRHWYGWITAASVLLCCSVQANEAAALRVITWAVIDVPPVYILSDAPSVETLGEGVADRLLHMVIQSMPEYRHQLVQMTLPRVLLEMRQGDPLCILNVQRSPERDAVAYSTPLLVSPGISVVLRRDVLAAHPEWQNGVSLSELVARRDLRGIYLEDRSFGPQLDAIVRSTDNVGLVPNNGATALNMLKMIAMSRADYGLDFPSMLSYLARKSDLPHQLTSIPIAEAPAFVEGHVLCTRNAWGEAAIRRIDGVLQDLAARPAYRDALYRWLPDDELTRDRKAMDKYFDQRARRRYCGKSCP